MGSSLSTGDKIAVVSTNLGGVEIRTYESILDMVLQLLNNGSISLRASCWGDVGHQAALDVVEIRIRQIREAIAAEDEMNAKIPRS